MAAIYDFKFSLYKKCWHFPVHYLCLSFFFLSSAQFRAGVLPFCDLGESSGRRLFQHDIQRWAFLRRCSLVGDGYDGRIILQEVQSQRVTLYKFRRDNELFYHIFLNSAYPATSLL